MLIPITLMFINHGLSHSEQIVHNLSANVELAVDTLADL